MCTAVPQALSIVFDPWQNPPSFRSVSAACEHQSNHCVLASRRPSGVLRRVNWSVARTVLFEQALKLAAHQLFNWRSRRRDPISSSRASNECGP